jgi:antitoxin Phd
MPHGRCHSISRHPAPGPFDSCAVGLNRLVRLVCSAGDTMQLQDAKARAMPQDAKARLSEVVPVTRWQLQDAKARLSEVVRCSEVNGPQEITVRGRATAVLLSKADYDRLRGHKPSFLNFLRRSPLVGQDPPVRRDRSRTRYVRL